MEVFEILNEMGKLCDTHDILFEVNGFGVIIRKYFNFCGKPYKFNKGFTFECFRHRGLEDCVLEFEKELEVELDKLNSEEKCSILNSYMDELSKATTEENAKK